MLSNLFSTYILFTLPVLWGLAYLKIQYIPILAINALLIYITLSNFALLDNLILIMEISALLSVIFCTFHNRRYKTSGLLYLSLISTGIFLVSLMSSKGDFLKEIVLLIPIKRELIETYYRDIYLSFSLLLLIGAIPFSEWIIHLFTISNSFFKSICFITPMFVSLLLYTKYKIDNLISSDVIIYLGTIIGTISGLFLIFEKKIRKIFVLIICYFYGIQILLIGENHIQSSFLLNIWLIISLLIVSASNFFTPFRVKTYLLNDVKEIFLQNIYYKITSFALLFSLVGSFLIYFIANSTKTNQFTILVFCIFSCFLSKITYLLLTDEDKNSKSYIKNTYKIDKIRLYRHIFSFSILLFFLTYVAVNYFKMYAFSSKHAVVDMSIKIGNKINIQMLSSVAILLVSFVLFLVISPLLIPKQRPSILKGRSYWNVFVNIGNAFKTAFEVIMSAITEFFSNFKQYIKKTSSSSLENKLTNILYGNSIYYYVFFLLQIIIVLTIECVIT